MPKSKGRTKKSATRYQLRPARKKQSKASPRWYGPMVLGVMGVGVMVIVLNYIGLMPTTHGNGTSLFLFVGLGLIALGFIGTTFWT
ncbi:MAG: cell division protein CrgA [Actinomycetota bacterium]|nr:cell division protein CrgA [Actinomycetota bacterium]